MWNLNDTMYQSIWTDTTLVLTQPYIYLQHYLKFIKCRNKILSIIKSYKPPSKDTFSQWIRKTKENVATEINSICPTFYKCNIKID